jgi:hypothetical protein
VFRRYRSGNLVSAIEPLNALFPGIVYATRDRVPMLSQPKYGPAFVFSTRQDAERFGMSVVTWGACPAGCHAEVWEVDAQEDKDISCFRLGLEVMRHQPMTDARRHLRSLVHRAYFEDGAVLDELRQSGFGGDYIGHFPIYYDLPVGTVMVHSVRLVVPLLCRGRGHLCDDADNNYRSIVERANG